MQLGNVLFAAENYRSMQMQERGVSQRVVPKTGVLNEAIKLERILVEKPRLSLVTLKDNLTAEIKEKLPEIIKKELEMHEITFQQTEVANRIGSLFDK